MCFHIYTLKTIFPSREARMSQIVFCLKFKFPAMLEKRVYGSTDFLFGESIYLKSSNWSGIKPSWVYDMRLYSRSRILLFFCCCFNKIPCFRWCPLLHTPCLVISLHALKSASPSPAARNSVKFSGEAGANASTRPFDQVQGNKDGPTYPCSEGVSGNRNSRKAAQHFTQISWAVYSYPGGKRVLSYHGKKQHKVLRERNSTGTFAGTVGNVTYIFPPPPFF